MAMPWQNTRLGAGEGERTAELGEMRHGQAEEGSEARATKWLSDSSTCKEVLHR